jgi:hypothetical protein
MAATLTATQREILRLCAKGETGRLGWPQDVWEAQAKAACAPLIAAGLLKDKRLSGYPGVVITAKGRAALATAAKPKGTAPAKAKAAGILSPLKPNSTAAADAKPGARSTKPAGGGKAGKTKAKAAPRKTRAAAKGGVVAETEPKPVKYEKSFAGLARRMVLAKVPEDEIADFFHVDTEQLEWWKEEHHEFHDAFRPDLRNYGGRPTTWDDRNVTIAEQLAALGATDLEIAQAFEVSIRTIHRWKLEYPAFREALMVGKEAADAKVAESLFKRATGYSFDSEKVFFVDGEAHRVEIIEHVPPDTKAAMWWLQNRNPKEWRDVRHIKHDVEEGSNLDQWLNKLNGSVVLPVADDEGASDDAPEAGGLIVDEG